MLVIEKGVPIPETRGRHRHNGALATLTEYVAALEVADSVHVPWLSQLGSYSEMWRAMWPERAFLTRKADEGGLRIWRVK
jgi:hypothetical protein